MTEDVKAWQDAEEAYNSAGFGWVLLGQVFWILSLGTVDVWERD